jgi:hypothetical protein
MAFLMSNLKRKKKAVFGNQSKYANIAAALRIKIKRKGGWGCSSIAQHLLNPPKALSFIPTLQKKEKDKKRKQKKSKGCNLGS